VCFRRCCRMKMAPRKMSKIKTPAPTPMPIFVARFGPLSSIAELSADPGIGGAGGSPVAGDGVDEMSVEDEAEATKLVVSVETEGDDKEGDCESVGEVTVVACVVDAPSVETSNTEDIEKLKT
jgi:hypothetical protein